jgi:hypothetical protein
MLPRAVVGLLTTTLLGCGYACAHDHACPDAEGDDEVAVAVERAARWLSRQSIRGDEAWFLRQGAAALDGPFEAWSTALWVDPTRSKGGDGRMAQLGLHRFEPLPPPAELQGLAAGALPEPKPIELEDRQLGFKVMSAATRCDRFTEEEARAFGKNLMRRSHAYLATAQLWAVVTAILLDCGDGPLFERRRSLLARHVQRELLADPSPHDLTAERMAVLHYAGLGDEIPDDYVASLVQAQHPVGAWLDPHFEGGPYARPTAMHMTSVAFYALAHEAEGDR